VLAEARHTEDPALLLATGRAELVADRPDDAIRVLERAVALQPSSVDAHLALAAAYRRNEQYARSRVASDTALKISPTNAAARFERLRQVLTDPDASAAELEAAVDDVKQFLAQHPNDPRGSLLRGLSLYRMSGQRDTALARLAQAHQTLRSIDSTVLLADALSFAGKPEEAVKVLEAWVSARPGNNYARLRLAQARLAAGDFDKAATDVATAIENGARRSGLAMMAAWTMAQAGRASEARQFLQQAEAEGAASALVDHTKGRLRLESGDAPGALRLLERATEQYANTAAPPALQLDYARALSGSGKRQAAQNILQNMLAQESLSQHQRDEIQAMLAQLP
jgi:tetratricopeptide (TPR) repeat protein